MIVRETCEKTYVGLKESVAITLSTHLGLATECLGVRVATFVAKEEEFVCLFLAQGGSYADLVFTEIE